MLQTLLISVSIQATTVQLSPWAAASGSNVVSESTCCSAARHGRLSRVQLVVCVICSLNPVFFSAPFLSSTVFVCIVGRTDFFVSAVLGLGLPTSCALNYICCTLRDHRFAQ